jgi:hypothetical protein
MLSEQGSLVVRMVLQAGFKRLPGFRKPAQVQKGDAHSYTYLNPLGINFEGPFE